jgi:hypothetical protein
VSVHTDERSVEVCEERMWLRQKAREDKPSGCVDVVR